MFRRFRLFGAVGLAFDLEDDRALNQTVEEGHRQRAIRKIVSPFVEVHIGNQRRGSLLIARGDDLVKQVRRLRTFSTLDLVEPEFVYKCSAEHLSIWTKPLRGIRVGPPFQRKDPR